MILKRGHSKSMFVVEDGGRSILKRQTKVNGEEGQAYLKVLFVKKIARFFKYQTEFFLISSLAVAKGFAVLSLVQHKKVFFY